VETLITHQVRQEDSFMPTLPVILHWVATYGAPGLFVVVGVAALGVGVPIPVTALLLTLGALSGMPGGPSLATLALAGTAGIATGHTIDYGVGRLGHRVAQRWLGRTPAQRSDLLSLLQRALAVRGGLVGVTFVSRFLLTPIASPVSLLAGIACLRGRLYLGIELLGTGIYVGGNLWVGCIIAPSLLSGGVAQLIFWSVVALVTLLPVVLVRLAIRLAHDRRVEGPTQSSDDPLHR
jgi:membrane protein DedA with SNARE-associated domain